MKAMDRKRIHEDSLPWFSPDESVEACELLAETAEMLEQMAGYSPLRKELRMQMSDKARACSEFVFRANRPGVDRAVMLAIETIAEKRRVKTADLLLEIVEAWISKVNRD